MQITLIIPAYNEEKWIGACLDSVLKYGKGRLTEIIVIDNASTDETARVAGQYPGVRVIKESRKGLTHARQAGLDATTTEFVAYIDADCMLTPDWFDIAERHLSENVGCVALTGFVSHYDGPIYLRHVAQALQWLFIPLAYFLAGYVVIGGNFIASRSALMAVGGFDTSIAFYGEDADVARRLSTKGKILLRTNLRVLTSLRRFISDGVFRTALRYGVNFLWVLLFRRPFHIAYADVRS